MDTRDSKVTLVIGKSDSKYKIGGVYNAFFDSDSDDDVFTPNHGSCQVPVGKLFIFLKYTREVMNFKWCKLIYMCLRVLIH